MTFDEIKQKGWHELCKSSHLDSDNNDENSEGEGAYSNSGAIFDKNGPNIMEFGDLVKKNSTDNNKYFWSILRLNKDFHYVLDLNWIESQSVETQEKNILLCHPKTFIYSKTIYVPMADKLHMIDVEVLLCNKDNGDIIMSSKRYSNVLKEVYADEDVKMYFVKDNSILSGENKRCINLIASHAIDKFILQLYVYNI